MTGGHATLSAALWALAATLLARFTALFGDGRGLEGAQRRQAGAWLRDVEALARRLLLAQAARLAAGKEFGGAPRRAAHAPAPPRTLDAARAFGAFRIGLGAGRGGGGGGRAERAPVSCAVLARRAQALAALLAAPTPYAQRLARRMARRRALVPAMLMKLRHRPHRRLRRILAPMFGEAPEALVGLWETPPPRAGPYAITFPPDLAVSFEPSPRTAARRLRTPVSQGLPAAAPVRAHVAQTGRRDG